MNDKIYIIAEAGVNHNGSLELAKKLIEKAAESGADAVKFQTFKTENVISTNAPKAEYQIAQTGSAESQYEMVKKLELDAQAHDDLIVHAKRCGIQFLSTPFDSDSLTLLTEKFDLPLIKIPSGEITNAPFLLEIALTKKPVVLSTGMATLGEIEQALAVLAYGYLTDGDSPSLVKFYKAFSSSEGQEVLRKNVSLLHCTTEYPAPKNEVNLRAMDTIRQAFGLPTGYSDHTQGIAITVAAAARGASIVEKHFTLDKTMPGPDHKASLEPRELNDMVHAIRDIELALGSALKMSSQSELKNKSIARKSLVAAKSIKKGEKFNLDNLSTKRPGNGISPFEYWDYLGKSADRDYQHDELVGIDDR